MRWGVERRLEFIEARLYWAGVVNRGHLSETFGISAQQASADFAQYLKLAPNNAIYDRSRKGYVGGQSFRPVLTVPDAARYLAQLRLAGDGAVQLEDIKLPPPSFDTISGPVRKIDAEVLRATLTAIRERQAIDVQYQSMSSTEPSWRWIAPHALAFDGFRWQARAFCDKGNVFKDFSLARVKEVGAFRQCSVTSLLDKGWHERVRVIIGPHPHLSQGQRKAIEADYGMTGGVLVTDVRKCFLFYFLKRFGLDDDKLDRRPQDQHVVLLNVDDVSAALKVCQSERS